MKIPWIFHKDYDIPLPKNHRFSSSKFGDLYTLLIDSELAKSAEVFIPNAAKDSQLTKVHTRDYISKIMVIYLTKRKKYWAYPGQKPYQSAHT